MVTIVTSIVYLKVARRVHLKKPLSQEKNSITMYDDRY